MTNFTVNILAMAVIILARVAPTAGNVTVDPVPRKTNLLIGTVEESSGSLGLVILMVISAMLLVSSSSSTCPIIGDETALTMGIENSESRYLGMDFFLCFLN
jgi:hypothetical protein